jgi:hypothetical protein
MIDIKSDEINDKFNQTIAKILDVSVYTLEEVVMKRCNKNEAQTILIGLVMDKDFKEHQEAIDLFNSKFEEYNRDNINQNPRP